MFNLIKFNFNLIYFYGKIVFLASFNSKIDDLYEFGLSNGSNGGKIIGAGGGGFILFQCDHSNTLRRRFLEQGIRVIDFNFVNSGTEIINV